MKAVVLLVTSFWLLGCATGNSALQRAEIPSDCTLAYPSRESIAEYLLRVAEALTKVKVTTLELEASLGEEPIDASDVFVALKDLRTSYLCAAGIVGSYTTSKNTTISKSSHEMVRSYRALAANTDATITAFRSELDGQRGRRLGEEAYKDAELTLQQRKAWSKLVAAIELATSARARIFSPRPFQSNDRLTLR